MLKEFFKQNWLLAFALLYIIFPIDIIPDALPLLGNTDDTVVLLAGMVKKYIDFRNEKQKEKTGV